MIYKRGNKVTLIKEDKQRERGGIEADKERGKNREGSLKGKREGERGLVKFGETKQQMHSTEETKT